MTKNNAEVWIRPEKVVGEVNTNIFGQQLEFMGDCITKGLWAEMLVNRKFGSPDDNGDGVSDPWLMLHKKSGVSGGCVKGYSPNNQCSQKITLAQDFTEETGIVQRGISVKAGGNYVGYVYLKQEGMTAPNITIALAHDNGAIYTHCTINGVNASWQKYNFNLIAPVADRNACFIIAFNCQGTLWIDSPSLMPGDNIYGMQRGVIEKIKELKPPVMRFPGGCFADGYHWKDGIGPRDQRPVRFDLAWRKWESNDFGTDEFMRFCQLVGAKPYITVNFGSGTSTEAAEWLQYCNGDKDSTWGAKRAKSGHLQPYNVKYWSIGNEINLKSEIGHTDVKTYAKGFIEFHEAMKKIDSTIEFSAVGTQHNEGENAEWNEELLSLAGAYVDYLSVHYYFPGVFLKPMDDTHLYHAVVSSPKNLEKKLQKIVSTVDKFSSDEHSIKIALDEWNVFLPTVRRIKESDISTGLFSMHLQETDFALREGLYAAGIFHILFRLCKKIPLANIFTTVNMVGVVETNGIDTYPSPIYPIFKVYSEHSGPTVVECQTKVSTFNCPLKYNLPSSAEEHQEVISEVPYLDCAATLDRNQKILYIHVINRHLEQDIEVNFHLEKTIPSQLIKIWEINAPSALSQNDFLHPETIRTVEKSLHLEGKKFSYTLPPHSVTVLECHLN